MKCAGFLLSFVVVWPHEKMPTLIPVFVLRFNIKKIFYTDFWYYFIFLSMPVALIYSSCLCVIKEDRIVRFVLL